ncbi:MAG: multidrug effflux MFS transporter [Gammaproteobacteria bacterium]|nr:multidrug effflux MFS transporter [Gammaproteobacteria bacterium]
MLKMLPKLHLVPIIIISLLGCCMEIDISIPSFPSIMEFFGATPAQVQNTLSINFFAFCVSGLFYGPLSEAWGRRGLMLFGATCFLVGALGCAFSYSIYQLMFWRFIQGLGASSTVVLGFAMISDRYSGDIAANYIGKVNAYITIFMASAPILGSLIINYFTWRANFSAVALIALVAWMLLILQLPETKLEKKPLKVNSIFKEYWSIMTHREFLLYASMPNMLVTAYLTFVGSAAFYYINTCNLSYFEYAAHQGLVVFSFSVMSFYAHKVVAKIGGVKSVKFGMGCCGISIALMTFFAFTFPAYPAFITLTMCLFAIGCAFPMSVTFAQSMEIVPTLKGVCSSFIMSSRLFISSMAIAMTGVLFDGSMRPVAIVNGVAVALALWFYFKLQKIQQANQEVLEV